jgi:toxin ParE1/3/4
MTYQVIIRPSAEEQLTTAYRWYEDKSAGLGNEFIVSVDACIQYISRNPFSFQVRYKEIRI